MQQVRKQHFVNQAYLRNFSDASHKNKALWVYPKKYDYFEAADKVVPDEKTSKQLCWQLDFYEGGDLPVNVLENILQKFETEFGLLMKRINLGNKDPNSER